MDEAYWGDCSSFQWDYIQKLLKNIPAPDEVDISITVIVEVATAIAYVTVTLIMVT